MLVYKLLEGRYFYRVCKTQMMSKVAYFNTHVF
jgi:hypothetical protein